LLLGKIVPNLLVAYGQMTMALIVAHVVFDVPIRGSLPLLYGLSAIFMFGTLGIGIFVSAASRTVPQAMQLSFLTFLPSIYLLIGKIVPNLLVAYGQMTMALIVAHVVFDVPIRGSLPLLYGLSAIFMFGTLGIGIFVSAASRTVPQAMQLSFLTFLPSIYL